jgi:hypothetical protein
MHAGLYKYGILLRNVQYPCTETLSGSEIIESTFARHYLGNDLLELS